MLGQEGAWVSLGAQTVARIDHGAWLAATAGKRPARARVGVDAYAAILSEAFRGATPWPFARTWAQQPSVVTNGGPVLLQINNALDEAVIVEAEDGEPFIVSEDPL